MRNRSLCCVMGSRLTVTVRMMGVQMSLRLTGRRYEKDREEEERKEEGKRNNVAY